eukprot:gnl/TRDRNA2_/TRDRNA2_173347_c0_seq5.p1 gnl/TRDRNA2_/TRDRNA2_173347_c0~~gnl/TRDRNA2_/TRDRNA2_173347_c0_seq5.p1  ORF type:complete len:314 (+),score=38.36 gnl/TRDRNA2_/TRDRNA2_173347_c0_seq5:41-982(+)
MLYFFWQLLLVLCSAAASNVPVTPQSCQFAVVGGGWAGIYAAWRIVVDERLVNGSDVCLFEASERFGGRTYTLFAKEVAQTKGLNIDIGAYRFALQQHLPADLLRGPLGMNISCYIPSCKPEPLDDELVLYRLVDPETGDSAGYGSALVLMMKQLSTRGVRMMLKHRLEAIYPLDSHDVELLWAVGGATGEYAKTRSSSVFLNLPRHALNNLRTDSVIFTEASQQRKQLFTCTPENYGNESMEASVKVYLLYEDAWWLTKLGLKEGEVQSLKTEPPIYIRYHDGPFHCHENGCHGALLVQYAWAMCKEVCTHH